MDLQWVPGPSPATLTCTQMPFRTGTHGGDMVSFPSNDKVHLKEIIVQETVKLSLVQSCTWKGTRNRQFGPEETEMLS